MELPKIELIDHIVVVVVICQYRSVPNLTDFVFLNNDWFISNVYQSFLCLKSKLKNQGFIRQPNLLSYFITGT